MPLASLFCVSIISLRELFLVGIRSVVDLIIQVHAMYILTTCYTPTQILLLEDGEVINSRTQQSNQKQSKQKRAHRIRLCFLYQRSASKSQKAAITIIVIGPPDEQQAINARTCSAPSDPQFLTSSAAPLFTFYTQKPIVCARE